MSKGIILVGATGCGKTYFTKQLLKRVNKNALLIFDTNNEWKEFYPYPFNPDIDLFLEKANRLRGGVILIEDATSFLSNRGRSDLLTKILVAKRHTKNTVILLFHSLRAVPKYLMDISTHLVLFKTNDPLKLVETAFQNDNITEAFKRVQSHCKDHPFWKTYPPPPGIAPPSEIVSLY